MFRIFLILIFIASNAFALSACPEPVEPACTSNEKTFKDKDTYAACTAELVEMSKKTKEYIDCMKAELKKEADEVQKKADAASDKNNEIIKKFNCKADPKAKC